MKKGVDKRGKVCYYKQVARERAARLPKRPEKSIEKSEKSLDKELER